MPRHVAIAATGPAAVEAGIRLVREGGNAVDAALAAMLVAQGTEPGIVSHLGGAYVTIWQPDADPVTIDGNVEMPGRGAAPERFGGGLREFDVDYGGGITVYAGLGSVATPGAIAAFGTAHQRFGAAAWAEVVAPAVAIARQGFHVGSASAGYLALTIGNIFGWDDQTRALLTRDDGSVVQAGDLVANPDLADTLRLIAERGWQEAYTGEVGRAIAADSAARGGLMTLEDLVAYQAVVRTPLRIAVRDWDLATNPPPSIGGPILAAMLTELAARGSTSWTDVLDVQRHALTYRTEVHDYSEDLEEDGYALLELVRTAGLKGLTTSASTAHISTVDSDGLACSITASSGYGSGGTVPDLGLMYNNCLGEPELNRLGLHALTPGTRLASNMAPTVARHAAGGVLAIGTPGADRITTALLQVFARVALQDEPLAEAVFGPRAHVRVVQGEPTRVDYESDAVDLDEALDALGLPGMPHPPTSMYFGGVGAAYRSPSGALSAAGDPRREAATGVA